MFRKWLNDFNEIEEDREIYEYGFHLLKIKFLHIFVFSIVALFIGNIVPTLMFITVYSMLRKYAGGYHAKSSKMCLLITVIITLLLGIWIKCSVYIGTYGFRHYILLSMISLAVCLAGPQQCPSKALTAKQIARFRYKLVLLCTAINVSVIISGEYFNGAFNYVQTIEFAYLMLLIMQVYQKHDNRLASINKIRY
ncbi:accessory gene regulator B family protein [Anaerocolumna xylanovorans]|uniref:Accessory gene regulator B n=1 Tax=Anaerocolumna xylanovorans DSM 12503 TaxID=1121345 RepID=A0A1M7YI76_9FIRM|nr:accessory gene regulator B family protein [Anaerocolumna xylanovorans]SHO52337.1 Accessory gene regulator B [Anaerocolumna xylanovorans DSM 12503]